MATPKPNKLGALPPVPKPPSPKPPKPTAPVLPPSVGNAGVRTPPYGSNAIVRRMAGITAKTNAVKLPQLPKPPPAPKITTKPPRPPQAALGRGSRRGR